MKKGLIIVSIVAIVLFSLNLDVTKNLLGRVGASLSPVMVGVFFALILKAPVDFLEKTILSSPKLTKAKRPLALTLSVIFIFGFLFLIGYLVVPELIKSVYALKSSLEGLLDGMDEQVGGSVGKVAEWLKNALEKGLDSANNFVPMLMEKVGGLLKGVVNAFLGLMLALTMLSGSDKLSEFLKSVSVKLFGEKRSEFLRGAIGAVIEKFSKYLGGSLVESVIFAGVCYLAFIIFRVPYALLLAVVVGFLNLVPTVGGYIGGAIGVIILFTVSWKAVLTFVAITLVLQQLEQVTTYPLIVGRYVGLSPFLVLLAVVVGGGLFGFWGFLLGVPVFAFGYNLINVLVHSKTIKDEKEQNKT